MIHGWRSAAALVALAGVAVPAAAQVRGIPVDNSGVPRGIGIHATVGFPNDDAGGGNGYGLTGKVGFGALGVTGMVSTSDLDAGDAEISLGGTLDYRVFGGPLVPLTVTLQAGAGWVQAQGSDVGFGSRERPAAGLDVREVGKVAEAEAGAETVVDLIRRRRCDLVVNTPQGSGARTDGYRIREAALAARIPCITTLSGAAAAVHAIAHARGEAVVSLQERIDAQARPA